MSDFLQFLHMGGYAGYVWSAYAITAIILGLSLTLSIIEGKVIHKRVQRMLEQEPD